MCSLVTLCYLQIREAILESQLRAAVLRSRFIHLQTAQGFAIKVAPLRPSLPKDGFQLPQPWTEERAESILPVKPIDLHIMADSAARKMVLAPQLPPSKAHGSGDTARSTFVVCSTENVVNPTLVKRWRQKLRAVREASRELQGKNTESCLSPFLAFHATPWHRSELLPHFLPVCTL